HDRSEIEAYLRRSPALHLYELGDLDDFFWPYTTWYAWAEGGTLRALFLVYTGTALPVLLALGEAPSEALAGLLKAARPFLPGRFYAHFSPGLAQVFDGERQFEPHGGYLKMVLSDPARLAGVQASGVQPLGPADLPEVEAFYRQAYPGNWFDPRMLETGCYYGVRRQERLACVAGVHVYSPVYRVAALGNIATLPEFRGQGLAGAATARLCQELRWRVDTVGLNVRRDNAPAIACYTRLGFTPCAEYEECMVGEEP
ncbi:MAG TPA: GNAT family N-acetyltransferase, partial [Anaerolineales bacterium]